MIGASLVYFIYADDPVHEIHRGSKVVSRLANHYPERCTAYAFLALSYLSVTPVGYLEQSIKDLEQTIGYNVFGYWSFFSSDDANEVIQAHVRLDYFFLYASLISLSD